MNDCQQKSYRTHVHLESFYQWLTQQCPETYNITYVHLNLSNTAKCMYMYIAPTDD